MGKSKEELYNLIYFASAIVVVARKNNAQKMANNNHPWASNVVYCHYSPYNDIKLLKTFSRSSVLFLCITNNKTGPKPTDWNEKIYLKDGLSIKGSCMIPVFFRWRKLFSNIIIIFQFSFKKESKKAMNTSGRFVKIINFGY